MWGKYRRGSSHEYLLAASILSAALPLSGCATGSSASFTMAPLFFAEYADESGAIIQQADAADLRSAPDAAAADGSLRFQAFAPALAERASDVPGSGSALLPVRGADAAPTVPPALLTSASGPLRGALAAAGGQMRLDAALGNAGVGIGIGAASGTSVRIDLPSSQVGLVAASGPTLTANVPGLASASVDGGAIVTQAAAPALAGTSQALAPVVNAAGQAAAPILVRTTPAVGAVVQTAAPITGAVNAATAPVVNVVTQAVTPVVAPVAQAAAPVTDAVASVTAAVAPVLPSGVQGLISAQQVAPPVTTAPSAAAAVRAAELFGNGGNAVRICLLRGCR